jgi:hypothetical protein
MTPAQAQLIQALWANTIAMYHERWTCPACGYAGNSRLDEVCEGCHEETLPMPEAKGAA